MTLKMRCAYFGLFLVLYAVWGVTYCAIAIHTSSMTVHSLAIPLDDWIPFNAQFEYLYILCYILPFVPLLCLADRDRFNALLISFGIITAIAFGTYLLFPVYCPRATYTIDSPAAVLLSWEQGLEWPVNNFPSLHAAYSWLFYLVCRKRNRLMAVLMFAAAAGVSVSALFVKQHFVLDIIAGIILAWVVNAFVERRFPGKRV